MAYKYIIVSRDEKVGTITLNRPERLNAFNSEMIGEILAALGEVRDDDEVRVLVITGAGRGFCGGPDIQPGELRSGKVEAGRAHALQGVIGGLHRGILLHHPVGEVILTIQRLEKPVIGMVNGPAAGAGMDIALACDIRFGSPRASFFGAHMQLGIPVDTGGTWFLPRLVGVAKALEIILGPEKIEGEEAYRLGLLNRLVPEERLAQETMDYARRLARGSPIAQRLAKIQVYKGLEMGLETALAQSFANAGLALLSEDFREAIAAFAQKRPPVFKDR
ncbi:MAG: enoyl-CoA hydratase/isomerase family protein [Dehalococcoidia bacterium]